MRLTGPHKSGITLIETVIALFLLLAGIMVLFSLLVAGTGNETRAQGVGRATVAAQNAIARVRAWAQTETNFASDWSGITGTSPDPDQGDLSVNIKATPTGPIFYSPCSLLEASRIGPRELKSSLVPVKVSVSWPGATNPVTMQTVVGEPMRPLPATGAIQIVRSGGPGDPVPHDGQIQLQAHLYDATGAEIPDAFFQWEVIPGTGNATFESSLSSRDGRTVIVQHVYVEGYTTYYIGGTIRVQAETRYWGVGLSQVTPEIVLAP